MTNRLLSVLVGFSTALPTSAALVWTGSFNGSAVFQEGNWTQNAGGAPAADTINSGAPMANDATLTGGAILISSGTGEPSNFGGQFAIGTNDLSVSNGKTLAGGNFTGQEEALLGDGSTLTVTGGGAVNPNGISGFNQLSYDDGSSTLRGTGGFSFVGINPLFTLANGSSATGQFVSASAADNAVAISLSGGSNLLLHGGGNPLNTATLNFEDTTSTLQLSFETFAEFEAEHLGKVTYLGNSLVFGSDPFALEAGDNALATDFNSGSGVQITAVPEPTSALLGGLLSLGLLLRRRRKP